MERKKGLTIVEALFAVVILIIVLIPLLITYVNSYQAIALARELTIANDDAKDIMERIRALSFPNIVTTFPNNSVAPGSIAGFYVLPDEQVVITYPAGVNARPLVIEATVSWTTLKGTPRSETYRTTRTQLI